MIYCIKQWNNFVAHNELLKIEQEQNPMKKEEVPLCTRKELIELKVEEDKEAILHSKLKQLKEMLKNSKNKKLNPQLENKINQLKKVINEKLEKQEKHKEIMKNELDSKNEFIEVEEKQNYVESEINKVRQELRTEFQNELRQIKQEITNQNEKINNHEQRINSLEQIILRVNNSMNGIRLPDERIYELLHNGYILYDSNNDIMYQNGRSQVVSNIR